MSASSLSPTSNAPTPDLPGPNLRFAELASEERINATVTALRLNGVNTTVVSTRAEAVEAVLGLVPEGAEVLDAPSQTLAALGLDAALANRPRFRNIRAELMRLRQENQPDALRKLGASPEVIVGSVHAITEKGQVVVASATGSQLGPYVSGAGKVIWVAGTQKIVPDLDTAFQRVQEYTLPRETERALKAYGFPSFVGKLLIINRETNPGRLHLILIRENLGF